MTTIRIGPSPARFAAAGEWLDGHSAALRPVALSIDERLGALLIRMAEGGSVAWPLDEVRRLPDQADLATLILAHVHDPAARLIVADPEARRVLAARCPFLRRRPKPRGRWRLAVWAVAAVVSVAVIVFALVPVMAAQLARILPPAGEEALGDATLTQIRGALSETGFVPLEICETRGGRAALDALTARLSEGLVLPYPVKIHVLKGDLVNAFTLPGGHVVFFDGLLQAAEGPDALAGVLAHELGHVAARDPTRFALQTAGSIGVLGLILGDFAGGYAVLFLANRLVDARYSRAAEAKADAFASARLVAARVSAAGLADLMDQLATKAGPQTGVEAHFATHPEMGDRVAALRAQPMPEDATPALTADAWAALSRICR